MYGFTAQNIQEVFPSLVEEDNLGYLQTAYGTYDAMYVEAIKALHAENKGLKEKIKLQEGQVSQLSDRLTQFESTLEWIANKYNTGVEALSSN